MDLYSWLDPLRLVFITCVFLQLIRVFLTSNSEPRTTLLNVRDDLCGLDPEAVARLYTETIADEVQIICLNLSGDINIGSIVRSANLFGVGRVHLLGRRRYDRRGAVGQYRYVPTEFHPAMVGAHSEALDSVEALKVLRVILQDGSKVLVVVEQVDGSVSLDRMEVVLADTYGGKTPIFLFGNEGSGVPADLVDQLTRPDWVDRVLFVTIPQVGTGRSHNVANAAAMVLWEHYRARELPT